MTAADLRQLAWELDTYACYQHLTGLDDGTLVAALSDHMADIRTSPDVAGRCRTLPLWPN